MCTGYGACARGEGYKCVADGEIAESAQVRRQETPGSSRFKDGEEVEGEIVGVKRDARLTTSIMRAVRHAKRARDVTRRFRTTGSSSAQAPAVVITALEANAVSVGLAGGLFLVAGGAAVRAFHEGESEARRASPARESAYLVQDLESDLAVATPSRSPAELPSLFLPRGGLPAAVLQRSRAPLSPSSTVLSSLGLRGAHLERLRRDGIVVLDGALGADELQGIAQELKAERVQDRLSRNPNHIASGGNSDPVRTDRTLFLDSAVRGEFKSVLPCLTHGERLLRSVGHFLEREGFGGFLAHADESIPLRVPDETQLAIYGPGGAFYKPHRDGGGAEAAAGPLSHLRLRGLGRRLVTGILYLNDNGPNGARPWREEDGGCLRVYAGGDSTSECHHVDIPPIGGRMVLFDAQAMLHEVRPNHHERAAITVWFLVGSEA